VKDELIKVSGELDYVFGAEKNRVGWGKSKGSKIGNEGEGAAGSLLYLAGTFAVMGNC